MALRKLNSHVPASLEDVVLKCLEKDPRKRPQGAQQLADLLERARGDVLSSARVRRNRAIALVGAAALVIAALVVQPWTWVRDQGTPDLRPVAEEIGGIRVDAGAREIVVPAFQAKVQIRFAEAAAGATLEAALMGAEGFELDRLMLAAAGGGVHEGILHVPALQQRSGMRARIVLFATGEKIAASLPDVVFAPEAESRGPARPDVPTDSRTTDEPSPAPVPVPVSRPESTASSRAVPALPPLPEVWATVTVGVGESRPEGPVQLKPGDTMVGVSSRIEQPVK
jgi:hypothetical protein